MGWKRLLKTHRMKTLTRAMTCLIRMPVTTWAICLKVQTRLPILTRTMTWEICKARTQPNLTPMPATIWAICKRKVATMRTRMLGMIWVGQTRCRFRIRPAA